MKLRSTSWTSLNVAAWLANTVSGQLCQIPLDTLFSENWQSSLNFHGQYPSPCQVSRSTAFEQTEGPVELSESPTEHLETPKLSTINATAWEQWEFDGTADSGMSGIILAFSRDASYHFFGQGNLRVEFYMILDDGTIIQELDFLEQSTVITCQDSVTGIWNSTGHTYGFQVPRNMSRARVWWSTPRSKGNFAIESDTLPHLADGNLWHDEKGIVQMSPSLFLNQPIAGGRVAVEYTLGKTSLNFTGHGGHGRVWARDSWFTVCDAWNIIRGFAGPYYMAYWRPVSRLNKGVPYCSAQLFKDGELLVGTAKGEVSDTDDYVLFTNDFSANVSGSLADRSTGHFIEFVSPQKGKTWRFKVEHNRVKFNMGLGSGLGLSGFTARVSGGEVMGEQYQGTGFAEQSALPEKIKQWQIWLVYGIGLLGEWKHVLFNLVTRVLSWDGV